MKDQFYISKSGEVRWNKFPEEHFSKGCHTELHCESESLAFSEVYCGCFQRYIKELQAAKDSSILCADQDYARMVIANVMLAEPDITKYGRPQGGDYGFPFEKDTVYPFPSEQYEVEVKSLCHSERNWDCQCTEFNECTKQVAVITPKKSPDVPDQLSEHGERMMRKYSEQMNEGKGEDYNHPLKSVVDQLMKQIEPKCHNYFTKTGDEFHGISWAEIAGIFEKYGYRAKSPF